MCVGPVPWWCLSVGHWVVRPGPAPDSRCAFEPVGQHGGGGTPREPRIVAFEYERQLSPTTPCTPPRRVPRPDPCATPLCGSRAEEKLARSYVSCAAELTLTTPPFARANRDELPSIAGSLVDSSLGPGDRVWVRSRCRRALGP